MLHYTLLELEESQIEGPPYGLGVEVYSVLWTYQKYKWQIVAKRLKIALTSTAT